MFSKGSTRGIAPGEISGTCCFWNRECEGPRLTSDNVVAWSLRTLCVQVLLCTAVSCIHPYTRAVVIRKTFGASM